MAVMVDREGHGRCLRVRRRRWRKLPPGTGPFLILVLMSVGVHPSLSRGVPLELLNKPVNAALSPPAGEGLGLLHGAEPLGKGRFRFRAINQSQSVVVPELGSGSAYTGRYSLAYGLSSSMDVSLSVPFLLDAAGGLNKYGTGDPVLGIKYSRPGKIPANFYTAYQLLVGMPLGYKGEHGIDEFGNGIRPFSTQAVDLGLQVLMDIDFRRAAVYLNGGYFRSGNAQIAPELVYGIGLELGRTSRWGSVSAEYWTRVAFAEQSRGAAALRLGLRINVFRGVQLEFGQERGFLDYPCDTRLSFGLRTHGFLTGRRRLESRYTLYRPPPPPRRLYEPDKILRIAVVDFAGYEQLKAGERVVDKLREYLAPHDSLEIVDLKRYADIPHHGLLTQSEAMVLARRLGVDVVVTGEVQEFKVDRLSGPAIPRLVRLPEARVGVKLRYRVLEIGADRRQVQAFIDQVEGHSRVAKGVRLLPADRRDVTVSATARELEEAQNRAIGDLAGNLLAAMAMQFSWVPPDFLP